MELGSAPGARRSCRCRGWSPAPVRRGCEIVSVGTKPARPSIVCTPNCSSVLSRERRHRNRRRLDIGGARFRGGHRDPSGGARRRAPNRASPDRFDIDRVVRFEPAERRLDHVAAGGRLSSSYRPRSSVTTVRGATTTVPVTVTSTPGNSPPVASRTTPASCPVGCANSPSRRTPAGNWPSERSALPGTRNRACADHATALARQTTGNIGLWPNIEVLPAHYPECDSCRCDDEPMGKFRHIIDVLEHWLRPRQRPPRLTLRPPATPAS